jgi:hypothetical protein
MLLYGRGAHPGQYVHPQPVFVGPYGRQEPEVYVIPDRVSYVSSGADYSHITSQGHEVLPCVDTGRC